MKKLIIDLAEAERMVESAAAGITAAQVKIASAAANGESAESINSAVLFLAECQGSYRAIMSMLSVLRYNDRTTDVSDHGSVRDELTEMLLTGADDSWSGRGNEIKRAEFDGLRKQVQRLLRSF